MHEILARVHALHLLTMHKMGSVRELDRTLARTLLAESARLHLIIGENFTKSLIALCTDLEASYEVLLSDIVRTLNLHPEETALSHVRRHLNLLFVCGACYSRSFPHGQALHKHMKSQCHSVTAIRDKTRSSRR